MQSPAQMRGFFLSVTNTRDVLWPPVAGNKMIVTLSNSH
jgi:hypothetical protein